MYALLKDILFPKRCVHCSAWGELVCKDCQKQVEYLQKQFCPGCKESSILGLSNHGCNRRTYVDQLISVFWYRGVVRSVITTYKYGGMIRALESWIGSEMIHTIEPDIFSSSSVAVVPVPLHSSRYRQRGFNQAEFIARVLASHVDGEVYSHVLKRVKPTRPQSSVHSISERKKNIKDAFSVDRRAILDLHERAVVLVDDVVTSGSTLQACAREIKKVSPAQKVFAFTLARG